MASRVCRTRVSWREHFGRVVELEEAVAAGQDIIREAPQVLVDRPRHECFLADLRARFAELSGAQRDFVASLDAHPELTGSPARAALPPELANFACALKANAHIFGAGDQLALFPNITLAPHSCDHNASYFDVCGGDAGLGRLYAIRDVAQGELVTISYIGSRGSMQLWPGWQRREYLLRGFGFVCRCARCEAAPPPPPTPRSLELLHALTKLQQDRASTDPRVWLVRAERHLEACRAAAPEDDAPFHLLGALDLLFHFHVCLFRHSEEHLLPAISLLAGKYALIAPHASPMEDEGLGAVFRAGAGLLRSTAESKARPVLLRLWERLGGQMRVVLGAENPDYVELCGALGRPEGALPGVEEVLSELAAVRACASCGVAAVFGCRRCRSETYCSAPCQRACWSRHKQHCVPQVHRK